MQNEQLWRIKAPKYLPRLLNDDVKPVQSAQFWAKPTSRHFLAAEVDRILAERVIELATTELEASIIFALKKGSLRTHIGLQSGPWKVGQSQSVTLHVAWLQIDLKPSGMVCRISHFWQVLLLPGLWPNTTTVPFVNILKHHDHQVLVLRLCPSDITSLHEANLQNTYNQATINLLLYLALIYMYITKWNPALL